MAERIPPAPEGFVFDDEPLECILYDMPGAGPTPAGMFASVEPFVAAIEDAFDRGDQDEGLRIMARLLCGGDSVSIPDMIRFAFRIGSLIPQIPCPDVREGAVPYDELLEPLFAAGLACDASILAERAGTSLYRYYEGCGRYADAARVVGVLLERANSKGNRTDEAIYTNNLGYDHLMAGDYARAETLFERGAALFAECGLDVESRNVRMNLLHARFEQAGAESYERFEDELNRFLADYGKDPRRRKALVLLARISERRGDPEAAARLVRQAMDANEGIPTRLRLDDLEYLERLEGMKKQDP